jgi:hypothetical protein
MEKQTLDQVVARNMIRLREERRWSPTDLAKRLGYKHVNPVSAREGRLKDRGQYQFLWQDIVALCLVFDVPIAELVLPEDEATRVSLGTGATAGLTIGDMGTDWPAREQLGQRLFGQSGDELWERRQQHALRSRADRARLEGQLRRLSETVTRRLEETLREYLI